MNIGQSTIEPVVVPGQAFVIESKQMKYRGVEIPYRGRIQLCSSTELIRRSIRASFDAGTHHPTSKPVGVVVSSRGSLLMRRHPTKLGCP